MKRLCIHQYIIYEKDNIVKICQKGIVYNIQEVKDDEFKINETWFPSYIFDSREIKDLNN